MAARMFLAGVAACAALHAQALVAGRVVDETGAGVQGAQIELRESGATPRRGLVRSGRQFQPDPSACRRIRHPRRAPRLFRLPGRQRALRRRPQPAHHRAQSPAGILRARGCDVFAPRHRSAAGLRPQGARQHRNPGCSLSRAAGLSQRPATDERRGAGQLPGGPHFNGAGVQPDQLHARRLQHIRSGHRAAWKRASISTPSSPSSWRPAASRRTTGAGRPAS